MSGDRLDTLYRRGNRNDDFMRKSRGLAHIGGSPLRTVINRLAMKFGVESDGDWEEQLDLAIGKTGFVVSEDITNCIIKSIGICESPIEKHLMPWLLVQRQWLFDYPSILLSRDRLRCNCNAIALVPQFWIGQFRVDFAFVWRHGRDLLKVVIECDGADYHTDRKKELVREKNLLGVSHVLEIVRFTGSEIYANPEKCAYRAAAAVHGSYNSVRMNK